MDLGFCQNGFDEIKNQWGWGGDSTQDIERCALSAGAVALIYNRWSWWYALARYIADRILAFVPHTPIPAPAATG